MPKVFENEVVFNYPATHALLNLNRKYPNPYATHVVSVDAVERTVDPNTGVVRSERIIGVTQGAPKWITKLFSLPPVAYVREVVFIDPEIPKATSMSVNLNLSQYVECLELITYSPYRDATKFWQRAMMVSGFPTAMIARRIEKASVDRFSANADVGRKGFEWVLSGGKSE